MDDLDLDRIIPQVGGHPQRLRGEQRVLVKGSPRPAGDAPVVGPRVGTHHEVVADRQDADGVAGVLGRSHLDPRSLFRGALR